MGRGKGTPFDKIKNLRVFWLIIAELAVVKKIHLKYIPPLQDFKIK